jgi:flavodoxin
MKKIFLLLLIIFTMSGCGTESKTASEPEKKSAETAVVEASTVGKKAIVIYFSRTGEEYDVGTITKGNTAIVAEIIAKKIGADTFEIRPAKPYPDNYDACTEIAKQELESNVRPALEGNIGSLAQYDTIFIGYPIWWGALPRVVLTFLESNNFNGKTIIPFCTHGGSGFAGTAREIRDACPNSKILDGLTISGRLAQNDSANTQREVDEWLTRLDY